MGSWRTQSGRHSLPARQPRVPVCWETPLWVSRLAPRPGTALSVAPFFPSSTNWSANDCGPARRQCTQLPRVPISPSSVTSCSTCSDRAALVTLGTLVTQSWRCETWRWWLCYEWVFLLREMWQVRLGMTEYMRVHLYICALFMCAGVGEGLGVVVFLCLSLCALSKWYASNCSIAGGRVYAVLPGSGEPKLCVGCATALAPRCPLDPYAGYQICCLPAPDSAVRL